ncbi:PAS domain-containing protein [Alysiella crassa]|uniref:Aerotaxis receptor n=1 Tax=Alysiella crassa TaxID=153491 RepID=A0A376BVR2_9NEIS|nr:PAS domain-containing protein [Alysiella crassa]UOP06383.1 PAS domain-containing protein [Alysiella crassa]SSY80898.1 Aerotaxis receptor [Alysiella crassa]
MSLFDFFKTKSKSDTKDKKPPANALSAVIKDSNGNLIMPTPTINHYREFRIKGYDGHERTIYATEEEVMFPDGCLITSKTNLKGEITHANESFITMSGWQRHEIIGLQHNVLRHPDMPSAVFKEMWETIQAGRKWHGYVKNLRKDSSFYWVYATVIPNIRHDILMGFTSVRRKPSRDKIAQAEADYQKMLETELNNDQARMIRVK